MYVIGLTGNFGTGKTTVSKMLQELGAVVISADEIGHEVLNNPQVQRELRETFGVSILDEKGRIDRRKLGEIAFQDKGKARELNIIMHHRIRAAILNEISKYRSQNKKVVILEAAVMPRGDWEGIINEQWVTVTSVDILTERLERDRDYTEEEVRSRLKSQMSQQDIVAQADLTVDTGISLEELKTKVAEYWRQLMQRIST
jgi:dephospho-CoA kinase